MANNLKPLVRTGLSLFLRMVGSDPFKTVTIHEFLSGYDDTLTSIANSYFPQNKRPPKKMGLFLSVSTNVPNQIPSEKSAAVVLLQFRYLLSKMKIVKKKKY